MSCHLQSGMHASLAAECAAASEKGAALRHDLSAAREAEVFVMRSLQSELRRSVRVQQPPVNGVLGCHPTIMGLLGLCKHHCCSVVRSILQNCMHCARQLKQC